MNGSDIVGIITEQRLIAIVRLGAAEPVQPVVEAIHAGGISCIEVSLTTPGALRAVAAIRDSHPDVVIGVGTVCGTSDAEDAIAAGARFLVTPVAIPELVRTAHARDVPIVMGAFSPTEVHAAHRAGADLVKLFPASAVGPGYLRALLGPFPDLRLVPTGGIDASNAAEWLTHGAAALGVGGSLTDPAAIDARRFDLLTAAAAELMRVANRGGSDSRTGARS